MNMESNEDLGRKEIFQAKNLFMRYGIMLVIIYLGFIIMTMALGLDGADVRYIEIGIGFAIFGILALIIYKTIKGLRLMKKKEEWR